MSDNSPFKPSFSRRLILASTLFVIVSVFYGCKIELLSRIEGNAFTVEAWDEAPTLTGQVFTIYKRSNGSLSDASELLISIRGGIASIDLQLINDSLLSVRKGIDFIIPLHRKFIADWNNWYEIDPQPSEWLSSTVNEDSSIRIDIYHYNNSNLNSDVILIELRDNIDDWNSARCFVLGVQKCMSSKHPDRWY